MSNNQKNLMSLLMGCVLAFGFLEVLFRLPVWLDDPLLPFFKVNAYIFEDEDHVMRYAPEASGMHLRWDGENRVIQVNSEGRRGRVIPDQGDVAVLLGDSVIFNGGVEEEETLDAILNRELAGQSPLQVLNYGISGTSLYHYRQRLEHDIIQQAQVKRVYVCFYLNDFIREAIPPFLKSQTRGPVMPVYDYHSYAIAHFGLLFRSALAIHSYVPEMYLWVEAFHARTYQESPEQWSEVRKMAETEWGSAWIPENWQEFDEHVGAMAQLCGEHEIEMVLVIFPVETQVSPIFLTEEMTYPQREASQRAARWQVPVIDLLPAFRNRNKEVLFFDHCHLTPAGNKVAASEIMLNLISQRSTSNEQRTTPHLK